MAFLRISGRVVKIDGDKLHVVIDRTGVCDLNCSKCGLCSNKTVVLAINAAQAKHGDIVEVQSKIFRMPEATKVLEREL